MTNEVKKTRRDIDAEIRAEEEEAQLREDMFAGYHLACALRAVEQLIGENTNQLQVRGEDLGGLLRAFGVLAEGALRDRDRRDRKALDRGENA